MSINSYVFYRRKLLNELYIQLEFLDLSKKLLYGQVISGKTYYVEICHLSTTDTVETIIHEVAHIIEDLEGRDFYTHNFRFKSTERHVAHLMKNELLQEYEPFGSIVARKQLQQDRMVKRRFRNILN